MGQVSSGQDNLKLAPVKCISHISPQVAYLSQQNDFFLSEWLQIKNHTIFCLGSILKDDNFKLMKNKIRILGYIIRDKGTTREIWH